MSDGCRNKNLESLKTHEKRVFEISELLLTCLCRPRWLRKTCLAVVCARNMTLATRPRIARRVSSQKITCQKAGCFFESFQPQELPSNKARALAQPTIHTKLLSTMFLPLRHLSRAYASAKPEPAAVCPSKRQKAKQCHRDECCIADLAPKSRRVKANSSYPDKSYPFPAPFSRCPVLDVALSVLSSRTEGYP